MMKKIGRPSKEISNKPSKQAPIITGYGTAGQNISLKLFDSIEEHNRTSGTAMNLVWRQGVKRFVLENSKNIGRGAIQKIVSKVEFQGWKPVLSKNHEASSDFFVVLEAEQLGHASTAWLVEPLFIVSRDRTSNAISSPLRGLSPPVRQTQPQMRANTALLTSVEISRPNDNVFSSVNLFHGFGHNLIRLKSILNHGILSAAEASSRLVPLAVNNSGSYSGFTNVSLSAYGEYGSFCVYTVGNLAVVVDRKRVPARFCHESGFPDEFLVETAISPQKFRGLYVPTENLNRSIGQLEVGVTRGGTATLLDVVENYLEEVQQECSYLEPIQSILNTVRDFLEMEVTRRVIERTLPKRIETAVALYTERAMAKKLGVEKPRLVDALRLYVPSEMPLYGSDGFPLQLT